MTSPHAERDETLLQLATWVIDATSSAGIHLYAHLVARHGASNDFPIEQSSLAKDMRCSEATVWRSRRELLALGCLLPNPGRSTYRWNDGLHPVPPLAPNRVDAISNRVGAIDGHDDAAPPARPKRVDAISNRVGAINPTGPGANPQVTGPVPSDPPVPAPSSGFNHHHQGVGVQGEGTAAAFEAFASKLNGLAARYRGEGCTPRLTEALDAAFAAGWTVPALADVASLTAAPWPHPLKSVTATIASRIRRLGPPPETVARAEAEADEAKRLARWAAYGADHAGQDVAEFVLDLMAEINRDWRNDSACVAEALDAYGVERVTGRLEYVTGLLRGSEPELFAGALRHLEVPA